MRLFVYFLTIQNGVAMHSYNSATENGSMSPPFPADITSTPPRDEQYSYGFGFGQQLSDDQQGRLQMPHGGAPMEAPTFINPMQATIGTSGMGGMTGTMTNMFMMQPGMQPGMAVAMFPASQTTQPEQISLGNLDASALEDLARSLKISVEDVTFLLSASPDKLVDFARQQVSISGIPPQEMEVDVEQKADLPQGNYPAERPCRDTSRGRTGVYRGAPQGNRPSSRVRTEQVNDIMKAAHKTAKRPTSLPRGRFSSKGRAPAAAPAAGRQISPNSSNGGGTPSIMRVEVASPVATPTKVQVSPAMTPAAHQSGRSTPVVQKVPTPTTASAASQKVSSPDSTPQKPSVSSIDVSTPPGSIASQQSGAPNSTPASRQTAAPSAQTRSAVPSAQPQRTGAATPGYASTTQHSRGRAGPPELGTFAQRQIENTNAMLLAAKLAAQRQKRSSSRGRNRANKRENKRQEKREAAVDGTDAGEDDPMDGLQSHETQQTREQGDDSKKQDDDPEEQDDDPMRTPGGAFPYPDNRWYTGGTYKDGSHPEQQDRWTGSTGEWIDWRNHGWNNWWTDPNGWRHWDSHSSRNDWWGCSSQPWDSHGGSRGRDPTEEQSHGRSDSSNPEEERRGRSPGARGRDRQSREPRREKPADEQNKVEPHEEPTAVTAQLDSARVKETQEELRRRRIEDAEKRLRETRTDLNNRQIKKRARSRGRVPNKTGSAKKDEVPKESEASKDSEVPSHTASGQWEGHWSAQRSEAIDRASETHRHRSRREKRQAQSFLPGEPGYFEVTPEDAKRAQDMIPTPAVPQQGSGSGTASKHGKIAAVRSASKGRASSKGRAPSKGRASSKGRAPGAEPSKKEVGGDEGKILTRSSKTNKSDKKKSKKKTTEDSGSTPAHSSQQDVNNKAVGKFGSSKSSNFNKSQSKMTSQSIPEEQDEEKKNCCRNSVNFLFAGWRPYTRYLPTFASTKVPAAKKND